MNHPRTILTQRTPRQMAAPAVIVHLQGKAGRTFQVRLNRHGFYLSIQPPLEPMQRESSGKQSHGDMGAAKKRGRQLHANVQLCRSTPAPAEDSASPSQAHTVYNLNRAPLVI